VREVRAIHANALRRWQPQPGDKWHLDEVFIKINGRLQYLWRAVDQNGMVLDILMQSRRDKDAAMRFFRRLLKKIRSCAQAVVERPKTPVMCSQMAKRTVISAR
jgi:putative transposase